MHLKADILAKVRQAFVPSPGKYSEVEIFRETAGQIILRARKATAHDRPVMLMVTVTELRSDRCGRSISVDPRHIRRRTLKQPIRTGGKKATAPFAPPQQ